MTDNDSELASIWIISGFLLFLATWAGLWAAYGLWAALLGWLPGIIVGCLGGLLIGLFWRFLLGLLVLAGLGLWYLSRMN